MTKLIDLKRPKPRFARSINVERDSGTSAIDGYLPVGRAIESIDRLARAMLSESAEVALSVTGPYGSGKSSLALVIDSLFAPESDPARASAEAMLQAASPSSMALVRDALSSAGASKTGFIRAVVTAQREPIGHTVVRALLHGSERFTPPAKGHAAFKKTLSTLRELDRTLRASGGRLDVRTIRGLVSDLSSAGPILLLIDEFGKNLEAFAETPGDGDLFLLQELAEWTRSSSGSRLALVTLQHMAFGDYADGASAMQRREWVKIQGRFDDIPFVDTPGQTLALVAASFEVASPELTERLRAWTKSHVRDLRRLGLTELAGDTSLLESCWPLHPLALAVLPDLCQRYGQNERTMFSFLAGSEPRSVGSFMRETNLEPKGALPSVHLDRLYDYFLESASSMVSVSADASRWLEIDTRIRDAHGLSDASLRVLKAIGLLNLVSAGGSLRASRSMLAYGAVDGRRGTVTPAQVDALLAELEAAGLVTYREFADEYRVWQGSDFDLKSAISVARRRLRDEPSRLMMQRVMPLGPIVAARHSHTSGTLRAFERAWADASLRSVAPLSPHDKGDGLVLYVVEGSVPTKAAKVTEFDKPVVFVTSSDPAPMLEAAREVAAIDEVLNTNEDVRGDWVVRKELAERRTAAAFSLQMAFESAFGATSKGARWHWARPETVEHKTGKWPSTSHRSPSTVISAVADAYYGQAVVVRNDLVNRHELSSQAAKARREVVEVMAAKESLDELGIKGFGPDLTLYLSVLQALGLHGEGANGYGFRAPEVGTPVHAVWCEMVGRIRTATTARLNVADLYLDLARPPFGLREGIAPVLLVAALRTHQDEFALYEHGTFRPSFTADVGERLLRNPGNFELKSFATGRGARKDFVRALAHEFGSGSTSSRSPSLVSVVSLLVARINMLPNFSKKTHEISAEAVEVRRVLLSATEPDVLIFEHLPQALGYEAVLPDSRGRGDQLESMASTLGEVMNELTKTYPRLVDSLKETVTRALRSEGVDFRGSLQGRAAEIADKVIDPRVKAMVAALRAGIPDEEPWLEYIAMQVTGVPPQAWGDDDRRRFSALVHDIGGTFRRVEALNANMRSLDGSFDAVRFAVNWSHGPETVKVVMWDETRRRSTREVVLKAVNALEAEAGSRGAALDWLMASLSEEEVGEANQANVPAGRSDAKTNKKVESA